MRAVRAAGASEQPIDTGTAADQSSTRVTSIVAWNVLACDSTASCVAVGLQARFRHDREDAAGGGEVVLSSATCRT